MGSSKKYWLDANIILRYIVNDDEKLVIKAKKVIDDIVNERAGGYINTLVLHEIIYVLERVYMHTRKTIASSLTDIISIGGIDIIDLDKDNLKLALADYQKTKVDFPDCVFKQIALANEYTICSFDSDFSKIGVEVLDS